jgi:hypothetical protein
MALYEGIIQYDACVTCRGHHLDDPVPLQHPKVKMTSETPSSVAERRLAIARRLFSALVAARPDRLITLRDGQGRVIASSKPNPDAEDNST